MERRGIRKEIGFIKCLVGTHANGYLKSENLREIKHLGYVVYVQQSM
jgi:hypothetical protein